MKTILDRILEEKQKEVERLKNESKRELSISSTGIQSRPSLYDTFRQSDQLSVIAEIKRASPSKGDINIGIKPKEQAHIYEQGGASAISVLTDTPFFKGTMNDLTEVRQTVELPLLCKDFIIDEVQIDRAKIAGANVILLIAAALSKERLAMLFNYATQLGLEVLFEVHNQTELEVALELDVKIIGINNRDLKTFNVDLTTTERLISQIEDPNRVVISESGITSCEDAEFVSQAGANGILVGETLMQSSNVESELEKLKVKRSTV
ncbi:indole-3-glycerol phosphate synthase TrpC [Alkalibacillus silvisoli]|uniref:Indole-3-glycerol phosphate synthase n=1 Tax=Alkalibacillus silvisoli TaxID=392823 RepID=A0ABP3JFA6_9BACI